MTEVDYAIAIFVKPGEGWGLMFGPWNHPERFSLRGFNSYFDAWAFCIAHGLPNPAAGLPAFARKSQLRPPAPPTQPRLIEREDTQK